MCVCACLCVYVFASMSLCLCACRGLSLYCRCMRYLYVNISILVACICISYATTLKSREATVFLHPQPRSTVASVVVYDPLYVRGDFPELRTTSHSYAGSVFRRTVIVLTPRKIH